MLIEIIIIGGIVLFDQLVKVAAANALPALPGNTFVFIPGFASFTYMQNTGAAFSLFSNATWLLTVLSMVLAAGLFVVLYKTRKVHSVLLKLSLMFIIGGAIGNIIDRIFLGYVRDMIEFTFVNFAVFNVADSFVTIGAVLLGIYLLFYWDKDKKGRQMKNDSHC
jgi:signal peptidase II